MINRRQIACCLMLMLGGTLCNAYSAVWMITYPNSEFDGYIRDEYPIKLLKLALDKTGVRYEVKPSSTFMLQSKSLRRLKENIDVNIVWSTTDIQKEAELLPIRIPISKGLIGWRVLLTNIENEFYNSNTQDLEQLAKYLPVQGLSWPDTKVLQSNGFNVVTSQNNVEAVDLIIKKKADFFPLSIIEVFDELARSVEHPNIQIKEKVALHYPAAMYFFVNKRNITLAKLIETGLERAIEDGSFDRLFNDSYKKHIQYLDSQETQFYSLDNPVLPVNTPLENKGLWFIPSGLTLLPSN